MTKGSDGTRVSPAHTNAQSVENAFLFLAVLSQGLLCPSGMGKGKLCGVFGEPSCGLQGQVGMAVGARMFLLVFARKRTSQGAA